MGLSLALVAGTLGIAPAAQAAFRSSIEIIGADRRRQMTGVSWRPGCPVPLRQLRVVRVTHHGFDGRERTGTLIVNRDVAPATVGIFRRLHRTGVRVRRIVPVEAYGGSDFRSIEADNTSAFNCRYVDGTRRWSEHAYGRAIDINPIENPYVSGGRTSHPASRPYLDRSDVRVGMAVVGGPLVDAFSRAGWAWGGLWSGAVDYQHFSASGS